MEGESEGQAGPIGQLRAYFDTAKELFPDKEIERNGKDGAISPPGLTKVDKELCAATLAGIDACLNALATSGIHADETELPAAPGSTGHAGTSDGRTSDVVASSPVGDEYVDELLDDKKAAADKELVRKPATTENVEKKPKAIGRELDRLDMGLKPAPKSAAATTALGATAKSKPKAKSTPKTKSRKPEPKPKSERKRRGARASEVKRAKETKKTKDKKVKGPKKEDDETTALKKKMHSVYSNAWAAKKLRGGSGPECKAAGWEERRAWIFANGHQDTECAQGFARFL